MPKTWHDRHAANKIENDDDREFYRSVVADKKPYFMTYVYPALKKQNNTYLKNNDYKAIMKFANYGIHNVKEIYEYEPKTPEMIEFLKYYERNIPVGYNPCIVNRICQIFENTLDGYLSKKYTQPQFDYSILKSNVEYSKKNYNGVLNVYKEYQRRLDAFQKSMRNEKVDSFECWQKRTTFVNWFKKECEEICTNENELCDIVIDICYRSEKTKQFAWDICGDTILQNLLKLNNNVIQYPQLAEDSGEFEYCGANFVMKEKIIGDISDCFK